MPPANEVITPEKKTVTIDSCVTDAPKSVIYGGCNKGQGLSKPMHVIDGKVIIFNLSITIAGN